MVRCWPILHEMDTPNGKEPDAPEPPQWEDYKTEAGNTMLFSTTKAYMMNDWGVRANSDFWDSLCVIYIHIFKITFHSRYNL